MMKMKYKPIAINVDLFNKATQAEYRQFHDEFHHAEISADDLATFSENGFAFCAQYKDSRKADNFLRTGFICLDFDKWNLDQALSHPFIKANASFIYTTCSHSDELHRFRVVFELEQPITNANEYRKTMKGLLQKFPDDDNAVTNPVFMASGNNKAKTFRLFNVLTKNTVMYLMSLGTDVPKPIDPKLLNYLRENTDSEVTIDQARDLLKKIPKMPGYDAWRNVCWAIANQFGNKGRHLIQEWSPDYKTNGRAIDTLFKTADGRITIGTLFYYAKH